MCVFQGLSEAAGSPVRISFTPTLMPMSRGMQSTIYVRLTQGASVDDLREHLQACPLHGPTCLLSGSPQNHGKASVERLTTPSWTMMIVGGDAAL